MSDRTYSGAVDVRSSPDTWQSALRALVYALEEDGAHADLASAVPEPPQRPEDRKQLESDLARIGRLRDRLAHLEQRERELSALYDTAQDLTGLRDVEQALHAIVRRARRLMNTDTAYLSAHDTERDDFYVRATVGTVSERFEQIRVTRNVGICGHVAREKRPYYSSDYLSDGRFAHEREIDQRVGEEEIVSILGVPLIVEEQVIGVLFVADRYKRAYAPPQIALLTSLAAHAAVAIESARLFEATDQALARERETTLRLQEQTREIESAAAAHDQFASLIARGGDLQDLSEVVAHELRGEVVIFDEEARTIYASHGATVRAVVEEARDAIRSALTDSCDAGRSTTLAGDGTRRVAAAVGAGSLQGGILLSTEGALTASRVRTLERSAVIAALVLLAQERVRAAEHRAITDLVTDLVKGQNSDAAALARVAERRGVRFEAGLTVMALDAPGVSVTAATALVRHAFADRVLVGQYDGDLLVLVNAEDQEQAGTAIQRALSGRCSGAVTVAYGAAVCSPTEVPEASAVARRCVRVLLTLGRSGVVQSEESLGPYALLFSDHGRARLDAYVRRAIGALLDHDEQRETDLAGTLLEYLDLGCDAKAASARLYIHPNTMRQRLRTVARVAPNWDDPGRRLEVHLALRLRRLAQQRPSVA